MTLNDPSPAGHPADTRAARIGDWMTTHSGTRFYPMDPRPEEILITDIAHALSRLCRFGGHVAPPMYSVAQHSVIVSQNVPPEDALWGLLHDAAEAYVVDVPRPVKRSLVGYKDIESGIMAVVRARFGLRGDEPASVREADDRMVVTEKRDVLSVEASVVPWGMDGHVTPFDETIIPWTSDQAEERFLARFDELATYYPTTTIFP